MPDRQLLRARNLELEEAVQQLEEEVSKRRAAEMALAESLLRWERLASATHDGVGITERGVIVECNAQLGNILGYPAEELIGMPVADLVAAEHRERVREHIANGMETPYEHDCIRKDGSRVRVEVCGKTVTMHGRAMRATSIRDVTERARNAALSSRLHAARRLALLGRLAASVTHQITTPAAAIGANVAYLEQRLDALSDAVTRVGSGADTEHADALIAELRQVLGECGESASAVTKVATRLIGFSSLRHDQAEPVNVATLLEDALTLVDSELMQTAVVERDVHQVPDIVGDRDKLLQTFVQVLLVACDALADSDGVVRVSCKCEGSEIVATISVRTRSSVDPLISLFVTPADSEDVSLGQEVAQMHGGRLVVDSSDADLHVELRLPLQSTMMPSLPPPSSLTTERGTARVLIVDDDPKLCRALARILKSKLDVVTAVGGQAALDLLAEDHDFDAVVCDITMPDVDGPAVLRQAAARWPGMERRFLFMTGGVFHAGTRGAVTEFEVPVLIKPLGVPDVLRAVSELRKPAARHTR